jgi:hypothetical protein
MAAPASEDLRELERLLTVAAETDDRVTVAQVREEFEVGHNDAMGMLNTLREHGKAVEVAPGEWQGPSLDELDGAQQGPGPVVVRTPDPPDQLEEDEQAAPREAPQWGTAFAGGSEPTVRLTMAIAEALDAEAIGKLVKAAIEGVEDGEVFVLEVTP